MDFKIPTKLLKTESQISVAILSFGVYVVSNLIFSGEFIARNKLGPAAIAFIAACMFQDIEFKESKSKYLRMAVINALILLVSAFGFCYVTPTTAAAVAGVFYVAPSEHTPNVDPMPEYGKDPNATAASTSSTQFKLFQSWSPKDYEYEHADMKR